MITGVRVESEALRHLFVCEDPCLGDDEPVYGEVEQLTSTPGCASRETFAHWSPDGTQLVYYRGVYESGVAIANAVYVMDLATGAERQLTEDALFGGDADWTVDGEWIIFSTYPLNDFQCCKVSNLYRVRPDPSGLEQLTHHETDGKRATQPRTTRREVDHRCTLQLR